MQEKLLGYVRVKQVRKGVFSPSYKKSFTIVLKLEGFLVWLTKSELTHWDIQNIIKITNRLHDVCETKKNAVHARESFIYSCIN
jgi:hypothetical protein